MGGEARAVLRSRFDYLIEVESEQVLAELAPNSAALANLSVRGFIVTCRGAGRYDFLSRYFAPAAGIAEDPVTGSAHCCLGPYWAERLGKTELLAYQASARGGEVRVQVKGDRVILGGPGGDSHARGAGLSLARRDPVARVPDRRRYVSSRRRSRSPSTCR